MSKNINIRFWGKVEKGITCWIWKGSCTPRGYGRIYYKGGNIYTHRLVWFLTYGKWPRKLICHHCDNPPCIRPNHLFEGTVKDNTHDSISKGRFPQMNNTGFQKYINSSHSQYRKMTLEIAEEIRNKYKNKLASSNQLAKQYNVAQNTIWQILTYCTYKK